MNIKAAVLRAGGAPLSIEEVDLDPPRAGEVLVRIAATGLCGSDLHVIDGGLPEPLPLVPGHEAAGVVEDLGAGVDGLVNGDRVILSLVPACGECVACLSGRTNLCEVSARMASTGTLLDGATDLVDSTGGRVVEQVLATLPGGADFAFEAVGSAATIEQAWAVTAAGGATVVVGLPPRGSRSTTSPARPRLPARAAQWRSATWS